MFTLGIVEGTSTEGQVMSDDEKHLAPAKGDGENNRETPIVLFPTPKAEPNLESAFVFPKDQNDDSGSGSISTLSGFTYAVP